MTDKELLELAAKAAGIDGKWELDHNYIQERWYFNVPYNNQGMLTGFEWNPLTDDGDALRLAVKLHMCLDTFDVDEEEHTVAWKTLSNECRENHNGDPYAATRRAIVSSAAEIGRQME